MFHPEGPTFFELAQQCLSSTEHGYDLLAPKFDYTPYRTADAILSTVRKGIESFSVESALDICCGTGAVMRMLRPICRSRVVGIDFSRGMLEVARQKIQAAEGEAGVEFVRGNVFNMPFNAEFDLAVCVGALGHVRERDKTRFIEQLNTILKPGGRFVFVTSYKPPVWSRDFWTSHAFNAAMTVRNFFIRPQFIMYYLTFLLPEVKTFLESHGFGVEVRDAFEGELSSLRMIIATRRHSGSLHKGFTQQ